MDYRTASETDLEAINDVANQVAAEWRPLDAPRPLVHRVAEARELPETYVERTWLVQDGDGSPVGEAGCWYHGEESFGGAAVLEIESLNVVAAWRRRGIGSTLLGLMAEFGTEHRRTHIQGRVRSPIPAGAAFAAAMGGVPGLEQRESEVDLAQLDLAMIDGWISDGPVRAPGYEIVFMTDGYERSCLPSIAATYDAMDDMPHGDLHVATRRKTVDQLLGADAMLDSSGETRWSAFAREVGSDRFAGVTDVFIRSWDPAIVNQGNTGVLPAHRGRRLGWWLKAAMARKIVDELPEARVIRTGNAFSNEHMLAINDAMGFAVTSITSTWELAVNDVLGASPRT